jgi:hypothetical protein
VKGKLIKAHVENGNSEAMLIIKEIRFKKIDDLQKRDP